MKRIFTFLALVLAGATAFASTMDDNGHKLTELWAQYQAARKADRPQKELEILKQIKEEAAAKRYAVDFYDAATEYVSTAQRRDWKQREPALKALGEEVKAFDEPIVTYLWLENYNNAATDYLWAYVKDHIEGFQGNNSAFYRNLRYLGGNLAPFIRTDKEFVLWRLLSRRSFVDIEKDEVYQTLKAEVEGQYPSQAALEFYAIHTRNYLSDELEARKKELEDMAARYAGRSVSAYPRADLLQMEMDRLNREKAGSNEYQELYRQCQAFEKERTAWTGDDAVIVKGCTSVKGLCEQLTAERLNVEVNRDRILVTFQNLKEAKVTLYDANQEKQKKLKTWKVKNPVGSFYVTDSVLVAMPVLSDGHYVVEAENGDLAPQDTYNQYTLSIAVRKDADGWKAYVTDHKTGQPLSKVKLILMKGDKKLASATVSQKGFTPLPVSLVKAVNKNEDSYLYLKAEEGNRKSLEVNLRDYYSDYISTDMRCNIYRDRGAYNPGDTLQYKIVLYKGDPRRELKVCPKEELTVTLRNAEGKELEKQTLTSNEYGSVSGSFVLPKGQRNGYFSLQVNSRSRRLDSSRFRVDEFVLPTYELSFDKQDQLYLVGDYVPVSGKLTSYSGHNLTGARVRARVLYYDDVVLEEEQEVGADNTFAFQFYARRAGYYRTEVTVTDATGEMRSFHTSAYIADNIKAYVSVTNGADGTFEPVGHLDGNRYIIDGNTLKAHLEAEDARGNQVPVPVDYALTDESAQTVRKGTVDSGTDVELDLTGLPSGLYFLSAHVKQATRDGKSFMEDSKQCAVLVSRPGDKALTPRVANLFISGPTTITSQPISVRMGSTAGPAWVVATLFGEDRKVLDTKLFTFAPGVPGEIEFHYAETYPDAVRLQVFYFMNGDEYSFERQYRREKTKLFLPLRFTRFQSEAYPGTEYSFALQTNSGVEALAAAWDKSLDAIAANNWRTVSTMSYSVPSVSVYSVCGHVTGEEGPEPLVVFNRADYDGMMVLEERAVVAQAPMAKSITLDAADNAAGAEEEPVNVRSDFSSALTFQPHLRSAEDGTLEFSFRTSDKLSTYYVAVYAHDKAMHNALVKEEMVVSLPVKVALVEPKYLYQGDRYQAAVTVSSITDVPVSGRLQLRYGNTVQQLPVTVEPGGTVTHRFLVAAPEEAGDLTLTASFVADEFSDAVQVILPVKPAAQVLTEAHSAVLLSGMDREALLKDLRSRFVNISGADAELREITVMDMVKDAIPSHLEPDGKDVLSLSEAWYVQLMAGRLNAMSEDSVSSASLRDPVRANAPETESSEAVKALLAKILACQNGDGGFGWFEGMSSSAMITAVLLERMAKLRDRGFEIPDMKAAVKYLDSNQFGTSFPVWRGWVSDAQYMHVRALYPEVPFDVKKPSTKAGKKRWEDFQKDAKAYLVPSKKDGRGLQGQILAKARRLLTLKNLMDSEDGLKLASAWGVSLDTRKQLESSMKADISSLIEYAVEHRDGGWYYPNAVMPWRGLMESEAYAHSLLCDLLSRVVEDGNTEEYADIEKSRTISNGIRLWLMLQKETQKWDTDPAYVDAITSILDGPQEVLDTRVLALSATYESPFSRIKAAGNGFTIERKFYRSKTEELLYDNETREENRRVATLAEIKPGDPVSVGDKILVEYRIWNGENRSFVKVEAGREATLRPVQQLSGNLGYGFIRPLRSGYNFGFVPQGYRNVKADRTEYFFDSYPEEKTTLSEEFYVTQAGAFVAPVITIESLYAPHYRANSASRGILEVAAN